MDNKQIYIVVLSVDGIGTYQWFYSTNETAIQKLRQLRIKYAEHSVYCDMIYVDSDDVYTILTTN